MAEILSINQNSEIPKGNPFKNVWRFVASQSTFIKLTFVMFFLFSTISLAIVGQRFNTRQHASNQNVSLYFVRHGSGNTTPLTTLSVNKGETVLLNLYLDTTSETATDISGFDIATALTDNSTFVLAMPGITEALGADKFAVSFFNNWENNRWRFSKFNTNISTIITGKLLIANIPLSALREGSGTFEFTKAIITSPNSQEDIVVGMQPLAYTIVSPTIEPPKPSPTTTTTFPSSSIIALTACGEITHSGNYILNGDLHGKASEPCLNIHDTSNVQINCNNNSIISNYRGEIGADENHAKGVISFKNVSNTTVDSCTINNTHVENDHNYINGIGIINSTNIILQNITFTGPSDQIISVYQGQDIQVKNSSLYGYVQKYSSGARIDHNKFINAHASSSPPSSGVVSSEFGSNNQITNNVIEGGYTKGGCRAAEGADAFAAADDGIMLSYEIGDLIQDNKIAHVWDTGIETAGQIENTKIIGNYIKDAPISGIGGWYRNNMIGNTFADNIVDGQVKYMFLFFRYDPSVMRPEDEYFMFKNNIFRNNKFGTSVVDSPECRSNATYIGISPQSMPSHIQADHVDITNTNSMIDNNFVGGKGKLLPSFSRDSGIVDGGGNICSSPEDPRLPLQFNCNLLHIFP